MCNITQQIRKDASYRYLDAGHFHIKCRVLLVLSLWYILFMVVNFLKKILKNKEVRWGLIREYNFKIECFDAQTFLTLDIFCGRNKIKEIRFVFSQCPYVLNTHYHNSQHHQSHIKIINIYLFQHIPGPALPSENTAQPTRWRKEALAQGGLDLLHRSVYNTMIWCKVQSVLLLF